MFMSHARGEEEVLDDLLSQLQPKQYFSLSLSHY
jgi:hypothetical protein